MRKRMAGASEPEDFSGAILSSTEQDPRQQGEAWTNLQPQFLATSHRLREADSGGYFEVLGWGDR